LRGPAALLGLPHKICRQIIVATRLTLPDRKCQYPVIAGRCCEQLRLIQDLAIRRLVSGMIFRLQQHNEVVSTDCTAHHPIEYRPPIAPSIHDGCFAEPLRRERQHESRAYATSGRRFRRQEIRSACARAHNGEGRTITEHRLNLSANPLKLATWEARRRRSFGVDPASCHGDDHRLPPNYSSSLRLPSTVSSPCLVSEFVCWPILTSRSLMVVPNFHATALS
jgi:hypothetical protein